MANNIIKKDTIEFSNKENNIINFLEKKAKDINYKVDKDKGYVTFYPNKLTTQLDTTISIWKFNGFFIRKKALVRSSEYDFSRRWTKHKTDDFKSVFNYKD